MKGGRRVDADDFQRFTLVPLKGEAHWQQVYSQTTTEA